MCQFFGLSNFQQPPIGEKIIPQGHAKLFLCFALPRRSETYPADLKKKRRPKKINK